MRKRHLSFQAIGTKWTIEATTDFADTDWRALDQSVQARIDLFDATYSRFRNDSLVSTMARQSGTYPLPNDAFKLINFYKKLYEVTDGMVTPLIGQVVSDAGYDAAYSLRPKELHQPPAWDDVISYTKNELTIKQPALLDFGAAGKGYLVDIVGQILAEAGILDYFVNAGGDIIYRCSADTPLRVGLENPAELNEVVGVASIHNQSLCASSGARRAWGKYHHIIDPVSLESPKDILATWVVASDTMTADGLATALFFCDVATLRKQFEFSYAILRSDMSLDYSDDFPAEIFKDAA